MDFHTAVTAIGSVFGLLTVLILGLSGLLQLIRNMLDELVRVMIKVHELQRDLRSASLSQKR